MLASIGDFALKNAPSFLTSGSAAPKSATPGKEGKALKFTAESFEDFGELFSLTDKLNFELADEAAFSLDDRKVRNRGEHPVPGLRPRACATQLQLISSQRAVPAPYHRTTSCTRRA